ncbi:hypothetical protein GRAN_3447 [Granulicella sibirica]|uniref:Uncharacterized protein n=1 Tax=Granulicella sibirica TaxID=2479048 RepID=A0A4Q0T2F1_9BACT|nr:hypothetical protein GRAN_3447 [Granulicella sibirica]
MTDGDSQVTKQSGHGTSFACCWPMKRTQVQAKPFRLPSLGGASVRIRRMVSGSGPRG